MHRLLLSIFYTKMTLPSDREKEQQQTRKNNNKTCLGRKAAGYGEKTMSTSVEHLQQRTLDATELLGDLIPSAITLATMLRHRTMATWLRQEYEGYADHQQAPPYRRELPGHIVAKSPQYGWIPAPVEEHQTEQFGRLDLLDPVRELEHTCLNCKKGNGSRILLAREDLATLQKQINLSADLAINISRDVYCQLLRTVRGGLHLWLEALVAAGLEGEHNQFSRDEKAQVAHLDTPQDFWRRAMAERDSLPVPDVRELGLLERMFGRAG